MAATGLVAELAHLVVFSLKASVALVVIYFVVNEIYRWAVQIKGFPGPRGLPVIGNLHQLEGVSPPELYRQWSLKYGPLYQIQLGNIPVVIVNTAAAAKNLLIGESSAFNSRPVFYVFHKFVSKDVASIGTSPWSESCKRRRKAAAGALNVVQVDSYAPILQLESREFIQELLKACDEGRTALDFTAFVRRLSMNLSLTLNYGTRIAEVKDVTGNPLMTEINYVESQVSRYRSTSTNLKNYIPVLRILDPIMAKLDPNSWTKQAEEIGERRLKYHAVLLNQLKAKIEQKTDIPCIQGNLLKDPETRGLSQRELLSISLSIMAGADSNTPTISWAILLLAHSPEIQEKAFQEIKASGVLDNDPFGNGKVKYIDAFAKEISRYFTVLRLAMPKEVTAPVAYEGRALPKGTMIFLNAWACNRDPTLFDRPFDFLPERWLQDSDKQPHQFAFGMGTRMCVASHLAAKALYVVFLHLIAHFHILPAEQDESPEVADPIKGARDLKSLATSPRASRARFVPRRVFKTA